jgi:hypothetical protein
MEERNNPQNTGKFEVKIEDVKESLCLGNKNLVEHYLQLND